MENAEEERYVFYRSCNADFGEAIRILDEAQKAEKQESHLASGYLYRYAVIVYFRPFTSANTIFLHSQRKGPDERKIKLGQQFIPADLLTFHRELKTYRDSAFAHSDIAARDPSLTFWRGAPWEFPIRMSPVDKKPLHIHRDKIRKLCDIGLAWTVTKISSMEEHFRALYPQE